MPIVSKGPLIKTQATGETMSHLRVRSDASPSGVSKPGVSPNGAGRRPSRIGVGATGISDVSPRNAGGKASAPSMSPNNFKSKIGSGARD